MNADKPVRANAAAREAARQTDAGAGIASPCTNVCRMNEANGWCEGCFRTIDEIVAWAALDDGARLAVWRQLDARRRSAEDGSR
jgi:hypothetical protein